MGSFLALRRAEEPYAGKWNMPGGFVELDESGPEAIAREVLEETGLEIETERVIGVFRSKYGSGDEAVSIFDVAYLCRITGGELEISEESSEGRWFTLEEFPEPAFVGRAAGPGGNAGRGVGGSLEGCRQSRDGRTKVGLSWGGRRRARRLRPSEGPRPCSMARNLTTR